MSLHRLTRSAAPMTPYMMMVRKPTLQANRLGITCLTRPLIYAPTRHFTAQVTDNQIQSTLTTALSPSHLIVEDTSGGCGAFYRIVVVSDKFNGLSTIKQHKMVNQVLGDVTKQIHGLTLLTRTPAQYELEQKSAV